MNAPQACLPMLRQPFFALWSLWTLLLLGAGCASESEVFVEIEAGDASVTLKEFARQVDVEIVYDPDSVRGVVTKQVKGSFTKNEAMDQLLKGTPLQFTYDERSGAYAITRSELSWNSPFPDDSDRFQSYAQFLNNVSIHSLIDKNI